MSTGEKKEKKIRKLLDAKTPFTVTLRQTQSRDEMSIFATKNHEKDAVAHAKAIAAKGGLSYVLQPFASFEAETGVKSITLDWMRNGTQAVS